ncbi:MAG: site-2 protease family protein [Pirellulales bacterium]|nr:site-2 protease family protein [Pirellulales bacterium]
MMLGEPPPTPADLHFRLFGFPIRVHPFFWVVILILGMGGLGGGQADPVETLIWVVVAFISILVHELGHAVLQRRYGGHPWITLYGMGGLSSCDDCDRSPVSQILISAAGPIAGFLLAGGILLLIYSRLLEPIASPAVNLAIVYLLWINIGWGLLNLLPIYPLDGGRIARELFTLKGNVRQGVVQSLWLSVVLAGVCGVFGLLWLQSLYMLLIFGYLAYVNYQTIQAYQNYRSDYR